MDSLEIIFVGILIQLIQFIQLLRQPLCLCSRLSIIWDDQEMSGQLKISDNGFYQANFNKMMQNVNLF